MRFAALAVLAALAINPAHAADPVGTYAVEGVSPGSNATYTGTATVTRTGDTFRVVWTIDGTRYTGTAIGNEQYLAVTYVSGRDTGVSILGASGANWAGEWTTANGTQRGAERWARR